MMSYRPREMERLISEVQQRPAIWDTHSPEYCSKAARARAWEQLCLTFQPGFQAMEADSRAKAVMDLQRRWKSLRDCFRRELLKSKKPKSGEEKWRREYVYFKQLSFLTRVCEAKPGEEAAAGATSPTEDKNMETEMTEDYTVKECEPPAVHNKRRKASPSEEQVLLQTLTRSIKKKANTPDDPDRHFLLGLLPHFKSLPQDVKLDVMADFIDIIKKYNPHQTPGPASTPGVAGSGLTAVSSEAPPRPPSPSQAPAPAPPQPRPARGDGAASPAMSPRSDTTTFRD